MQPRAGSRLAVAAAILSTVGCDRITKHAAATHLGDQPWRFYLGDLVRIEARAELLRIRGETASSATGADSLATGTTAPRSGEPAPHPLAASPEPGADFALSIDDNSNRTIYERIMAQLKEAAATGRLRAGERLPPVRELADRLGIAPGTVAAFHLGATEPELRTALEGAMEGIFEGEGGAGG